MVDTAICSALPLATMGSRRQLDQGLLDQPASMGGVAVTRVVHVHVRVVIAILAVVTAASLVACGGKAGTEPPILTPVPSDGSGSLGDAPSSSTRSVSVIADRKTLLLPDGKAISLAKIDGGAMSGYQTRDGWLVRGFGNGIDTLSLWLVKPDGSVLLAVEKAEAPVAVAADGRRIGWRSGGKLYVGQVNPSGGVTVDKTSKAPDRGHPISLTATTVVMGYSETGGGIDHHDVWYPDLGEYKPTWEKSAHVRAVFGSAPDGVDFLGLVANPSGAGTCLGMLSAKDSLKATRTACGLPIQVDRYAAVTRDGHWLALHTAVGDGRPEIGIVDLTAVFTKPALTVSWTGQTGPWDESNALLVLEDSGALLRFRIDSVLAETVDRPGVTAGMTLELLPRLV